MLLEAMTRKRPESLDLLIDELRALAILPR